MLGLTQGAVAFQSTLPARGSDGLQTAQQARICYFNPRSPQGGATRLRMAQARIIAISIHAPRKGERRQKGGTVSETQNFNPRSPQGGATTKWKCWWLPEVFQSTLPARGSDASIAFNAAKSMVISIHAPRKGERHHRGLRPPHRNRNFNPRSPQGGATN